MFSPHSSVSLILWISVCFCTLVSVAGVFSAVLCIVSFHVVYLLHHGFVSKGVC
jgi:hypothetical protein